MIDWEWLRKRDGTSRMLRLRLGEWQRTILHENFEKKKHIKFHLYGLQKFFREFILLALDTKIPVRTFKEHCYPVISTLSRHNFGMSDTNKNERIASLLSGCRWEREGGGEHAVKARRACHSHTSYTHNQPCVLVKHTHTHTNTLTYLQQKIHERTRIIREAIVIL